MEVNYEKSKTCMYISIPSKKRIILSGPQRLLYGTKDDNGSVLKDMLVFIVGESNFYITQTIMIKK